MESVIRQPLITRPSFATYLHPQVTLTSKPPEEITFSGASWPYFNQVRQELACRLANYPALPLRQADYKLYQVVHTPDYLDKLTRMAANEKLTKPPQLSLECLGMEYCLPGYLYGLGGMLEAIDQMRRGVLDRAYCFSLGGHHGHPDWGHGYCLLNPLAAAVRYAQRQGFGKILIVDWDLHHGDGTQTIFAHDPDVYCISIHSGADLYIALMGGLRAGTTTAGEEVGHRNIPVLDRVFDDAFAEQMKLPGRFYRAEESIAEFEAALNQLPWSPDLVCIFSGYDSHRDDCGEGITDWTNEDFQHLTRQVLKVVKQAGCPAMSVHGGGYKLPATIAAAVNHIEVLAHASN